MELWATILFLCGGVLIFPGLYFGGQLIEANRNRLGIAVMVTSYIPLAVSLFLIATGGFR